MVVAALAQENERLVEEIADLTYHVLCFLAPVLTTATSGPLAVDLGTGAAVIAAIAGTAASLLGAGLAARIWLQRNPDAAVITARLPRALPQLSYNKFYFDEIYDAVLVRPGERLARPAQGGRARVRRRLGRGACEACRRLAVRASGSTKPG